MMLYKYPVNFTLRMGYANQDYSVPVPSQDKLGGLWQKSIRHKNGGIQDVEAPIVRMGWRPDRSSVRLPLLSFHAP